MLHEAAAANLMKSKSALANVGAVLCGRPQRRAILDTEETRAATEDRPYNY